MEYIMLTRAFILFMVLCLISALPNSVVAGMRPENFTHAAEVQGDIVKGGLYRAHLPADILQHCLRNCGDLRLFDKDDREVPYVVLEAKPRNKRESHEVKLLDFKEDPSGAALTMQMPDKPDLINNLRIDTPNRDFRIDVMLYGSDDLKHWSSIISDTIYDFSSQVDIRKTEIRVPALRFKYLMLKMSHTAKKVEGDWIKLRYKGLDFSVSGQEVKNIRINRVLAEAIAEGNPEPAYDELPVSNFKVENGKNNETVIMFNTGAPLQRLHLDISNPYYFRRVVVFWDEKGKTYSREVGKGSIYRFSMGKKQETKDYIDLTSFRKGFYRIVIENDVNPPPDIKGIRLGWIQKQLFFVALADSGKYRLGIGSDLADTQNYDLIQFVNDQTLDTLNPQPISLSAAVQTAGYQPAVRDDQKATTEKRILISIVILLIGGMGFWLFMLLKKSNKSRL